MNTHINLGQLPVKSGSTIVKDTKKTNVKKIESKQGELNNDIELGLTIEEARPKIETLGTTKANIDIMSALKSLTMALGLFGLLIGLRYIFGESHDSHKNDSLFPTKPTSFDDPHYRKLAELSNTTSIEVDVPFSLTLPSNFLADMTSTPLDDHWIEFTLSDGQPLPNWMNIAYDIELISHIPVTDKAYSMTIIDKTLIVSDGNNGVRFYNIAQLESPTLSSVLTLGSSSRDIDVYGTDVFVANRVNGVSIINATAAQAPTLKSVINTPGDAVSITIDKDRKVAYISDGTFGLQVSTVESNPNTLLGHIDTAGSAQKVVFYKSNVYIADGNGGVDHVNSSDTSALTRVGTYSDFGTVMDLTQKDRQLHAASLNGLFQAEIGEDGTLVNIKSLSSDSVHTVQRYEDRLWVGVESGISQLWNLQNESAPYISGTYGTDETVVDVHWLGGNKVAIATLEGGIDIVRVTGARLEGVGTEKNRGPYTILVKGDDGTNSVQRQITLELENTAPVIVTPINNQAVKAEGQFSLTIQKSWFNDRDHDGLTLSVKQNDGSILPSWLTFNETTSELSGVPAIADRGVYSLIVQCEDEFGAFVDSPFELVVENRAPEAKQKIKTQYPIVGEGFYLEIPVDVVEDLDGDTLSYSVTTYTGQPIPDWLVFDETSRQFFGTPGVSDVGVNRLKLTVSDGLGGLADVEFFINPVESEEFIPRLNETVFNATFNGLVATEGELFSTTRFDTINLVNNKDNTLLTYNVIQKNETNFHAWIQNYKQLDIISSLDSINALAITVDYPYFYVADEDGYLKVGDLSNLENIKFLKTVSLPNWSDKAFAVIIYDNYLYVSQDFWSGTSNDGLEVYDISDRSNPAYVRKISGSFHSVFPSIYNNQLILTTGTTLNIYNLDDPSLPNLINSFETGSTVYHAISDENYIYIAGGNHGIKVVDKTILQVIDTIPTTDARYLELDEKYLYLADWSGGFKIYDKSNPKALILMGHLDISAAFTVRVQSNVAFISHKSKGVTMVDVINKNHPRIVASLDTIYARHMDVYNNYLCLADGAVGVKIIQPTHSKAIGTPTESDHGKLDLKLTITDQDGLEIEKDFSITVNAIPKVVVPIPDQKIFSNETFSYQIPEETFSDIDHGELTLSVAQRDGSSLPSWITFNRSTWVLSGEPRDIHIGNMGLNVTATDEYGASVTTPLDLTIKSRIRWNERVITDVLSDLIATEGQLFELTIPSNSLYNSDNDQLDYGLTSNNGTIPSWLNMSSPGLWRGTPAESDHGKLDLKLTITDEDGLEIEKDFSITINAIPKVNTPIPSQKIFSNETFSYQIPEETFSDIDNGELTISVAQRDGSSLPSWMTFNSSNWILSGEPRDIHIGNMGLNVTATDEYGASVTTPLDLTIKSRIRWNERVITDVLSDLIATEGRLFELTIPSNSLYNSDNDQLDYELTSNNGTIPSWLNMSSPGLWRGTPAESDHGKLDLKLTITDEDGLEIEKDFSITVNAIPKVVVHIPSQKIFSNETFSYQIPEETFSDIDHGELTLSVAQRDGGSLPSWITFNRSTWVLSGEPRDIHIGNMDLNVTATDEYGATATTALDLTIKSRIRWNEDIIMTVLSDLIATEGQLFELTIPSNSLYNSDNDQLDYGLTSNNGTIPSWLNMSSPGLWRGTPAESDHGKLDLKLTITDEDGLEIEKDFSITVNAIPKVVVHIPSQKIFSNETFSYQIPEETFSDIDNGELTISVAQRDGSSLPSWMTFNSSTWMLSGEPRDIHIGNMGLNVTATDEYGASVTTPLDLTIKSRIRWNEDIIMTVLSDLIATEGQLFELTLPSNSLYNSDNDQLDYGLTSSNGTTPSWLNMSSPGLWRGTPAESDHGKLDLKLTVTDEDGLEIEKDFSITVNPIPKVNTPIPSQKIFSNETFSYQIPEETFSDIDHGELTLSVAQRDGGSLPSWMTFNSSTWMLSGEPRDIHIGNMGLNVTATDEYGASVTTPLDLTIKSRVSWNERVITDVLSDLIATEGQLFELTIPSNSLYNSDNDQLDYGLTSSNGTIPSWLNMSSPGLWRGTPAESDHGKLDLKLTITDEDDLEIEKDFSITVNAIPKVNIPIPNQKIFSEETFSVLDDVDTSITISTSSGASLPSWLHFDSTTKTLEGRPEDIDLGTLTLIVSADYTTGAVITTPLTLDIKSKLRWNDAIVDPVLLDLVATEGELFTLTLPSNSFYNADNDRLNYTMTYNGGALPSWLTMSAPGQWQGIPSKSDHDVATLSISIIDEDTIAINKTTTLVVNANPTLDSLIPDFKLYALDIETYPIPSTLFSDIDNSELEIDVTVLGGNPLPSWISYNATTAALTFSPAQSDVGSLTLVVKAIDAYGAEASTTMNVITKSRLSWDMPLATQLFSNVVAPIGRLFELEITDELVNNHDGDSLSLTLRQKDGSSLASWLTVSGRTIIGTPSLADKEELELILDIEDEDENRIEYEFRLRVSSYLYIATPIPDQRIPFNVAWSWQIPSTTFGSTQNTSITRLELRTEPEGETLPSWLHFDPVTGTLSGTPGVHDLGLQSLKVIGSDDYEEVESPLNLNITNDYSPEVTHPLSTQIMPYGIPYSSPDLNHIFTDSDGQPVTVSTVSLSQQSWLNMTHTNGTRLEGVPTKDNIGEFNVTVLGSDGIASSPFTFMARVINIPPVSLGIPTQNAVTGTLFKFSLSDYFSDPNNGPLRYDLSGGANGLPLGLTFNRTSGEVHVTLTSEGKWPLTAYAIDEEGASITDMFDLEGTKTNDKKRKSFFDSYYLYGGIIFAGITIAGSCYAAYVCFNRSKTDDHEMEFIDLGKTHQNDLKEEQERSSLPDIMKVWYGKYTRNQPHYKIHRPKPDGNALGGIYLKKPTKPGKEHAKESEWKPWLGKLGLGAMELESQATIGTTSLLSRAQNMNAVAEKIAADVYGSLSGTHYIVPKTRLAMLPVLNQYTHNNPTVTEILNLLNVDQRQARREVLSVHVMSKLVDGFQNIGTAHVDEQTTVIDYIIQQGCPPRHLLYEGRQIPLEGLMEILAVSRLMADTDVMGGSGANIGFVYEKNEEGHVIKAKAVKVDPGFSFNFSGPQNMLTQMSNPYATRKLADSRDLQIGNNLSHVIQWTKLHPIQKIQFMTTLYNGLRNLKNEGVLRFFVERNGEFNKEKVIYDPAIVPRFIQHWTRYINEQEIIYTQSLGAYQSILTGSSFLRASIEPSAPPMELVVHDPNHSIEPSAPPYVMSTVEISIQVDEVEQHMSESKWTLAQDKAAFLLTLELNEDIKQRVIYYHLYSKLELALTQNTEQKNSILSDIKQSSTQLKQHYPTKHEFKWIEVRSSMLLGQLHGIDSLIQTNLRNTLSSWDKFLYYNALEGIYHTQQNNQKLRETRPLLLSSLKAAVKEQFRPLSSHSSQNGDDDYIVELFKKKFWDLIRMIDFQIGSDENRSAIVTTIGDGMVTHLVKYALLQQYSSGHCKELARAGIDLTLFDDQLPVAQVWYLEVMGQNIHSGFMRSAIRKLDHYLTEAQHLS